MSDIHRILERTKKHFGVKSDSELARILKIPISNIGTWKSRNTIPYALLHDLASTEGLSLDYLIFGKSHSETKITRASLDKLVDSMDDSEIEKLYYLGKFLKAVED